MVEFQLEGPVTLAGVAPGVVVPVSGTLSAPPSAYLGTVAYIGTIGTIIAGPSGGAAGGYSTVTGTVVVGTIQNAPLVTVQGMIAVSVAGYVGTLAQVGTVGTVASPVAVGSVLSPVTVGSVTSPVAAAVQQQFAGTALLTNAVLAANGAATVQMASLQDLVVQFVFGTAVAGSVQGYIADVEEQTGFQTSTIVAAAWFAGTVRGGHRLVAPGPLGYLVAVGWNMASGGTQGVGIVTNVYITARLSEGP